MITNLVFQGGSVKGIAYIGALKALEEHINLSAIKRVAGTSAGAITAMLLAIGCTTKESEQLVSEFNFKELLDDPTKGVGTSGKVLKTVGKVEEKHSPFFAKIPAKTVAGPIAYRLGTQFGIYEGEYFRLWAENLIQLQINKLTQGKVNGKYLTFAELHTLVEQYPQHFRDLYVVGVNLNTGKKKILCYNNPDTRDVIIADAIRISMSIPYLFKPHRVYKKIDGERCLDAKEHCWIDGGIYDNYPIRCFDDPKFRDNAADVVQIDAPFYNPETLGFRLVSTVHKDYFENGDEVPEEPIDGLLAFSKAFIKGLLAKQDDEHDLVPADKQRTIYIDHLGISTLAFGLKKEQQETLIISGANAVNAHYSKKDNKKSFSYGSAR